MALGNSNLTSDNQNIDVTIQENDRLYESLDEKFADLKIIIAENSRLRREHTQQTSSIPLTTKQILSSLKNAKLFESEQTDEEHTICSLEKIIPTLLDSLKLKEEGLRNLQKKKSFYAQRIFDLQEIAEQMGINTTMKRCRHCHKFSGLLCDYPGDPSVSVHFTKLHRRSQKNQPENPLLRRDIEHLSCLRLSIDDATLEANESEHNVC